MIVTAAEVAYVWFVVLTATGLIAVGLRRLAQPLVIAEIFAGIVLGPLLSRGFGVDLLAGALTHESAAVLKQLGVMGIAAVVFLVALDAGSVTARRLRSTGLAIGFLSFVPCWLVGLVLAAFLRRYEAGVVGDVVSPLAFDVFIATAIAATAFPVLCRIIEEVGLRETTVGRTAIAASAAQELVLWPLVAVTVGLAGHSQTSLPRIITTMLGAVAAIFVTTRVAVPWLAQRRTGWVVILVLAASAAWLTDAVGAHPILGAFVFGTAVPPSTARSLYARLRQFHVPGLATALAALFFALPAMEISLAGLGRPALRMLAVVLVVSVAAKVGFSAAAAVVARLRAQEALIVGVLMNTRGLVELIILGIGLEAGVINPTTYAVFVAMALITTFMTAPVVVRCLDASAEGAAGAGRGGGSRRVR